MAEPTKLTQAQALFAVLAGAAQSRRERVYYRDGVLRSTVYGPIPLDIEHAINTASIEIIKFDITSIPLDFIDLAINTVSLEIIKTIAAKPEAFDIAINEMAIAITAFFTRNIASNDTAINNAAIVINTFEGVYPEADDSATNNATITVVKL